MTVKRYLYTPTLLLILAFTAVCGITLSADAQKVYALLIILGNDRNIRDSVNVNDSNMQTLLRLLSDNCEVQMTVMKSASETTGVVTQKTLANASVTSQHFPRQLGIIKASQVTAWIQNLRSNSADTILIYYSGHGMIDEDGVHILNFDPNVTNDSITRNGLRKRLQQKPARLKMLITDTCSNQGQGSGLIAKSYGKVVPRKRRYTETLFLKHSGLLDLTAASPGQYAWGNNQIGGYFTAALIESFTASSDTNKDGLLSWKEVYSATRRETQRLFSETTFQIIDVGQKTQTPKVSSWPKLLRVTRVPVVPERSRGGGSIVFGHELSREEEILLLISVILIAGILFVLVVKFILKAMKGKQTKKRTERNSTSKNNPLPKRLRRSTHLLGHVERDLREQLKSQNLRGGEEETVKKELKETLMQLEKAVRSELESEKIGGGRRGQLNRQLANIRRRKRNLK